MSVVPYSLALRPTVWRGVLLSLVASLRFGLGPLGLPAQEILINEVQTANVLTLIDENGDTPDWLELYNPGPAVVDLAGYGLSDEATNAFKWVFTNASVSPGGFLLVYASDKNRQPTSALAIDPSTVPGLVVWLRADAIVPTDPAQVRTSGGNAFVLQWNDASGSNRHARQSVETNQPRYVAAAASLNNQPAVRFDGVDDLLRLAAVPAMNSFCVMAVFRAAAGHEVDAQAPSGVGGVSGQRYLFGAAHGGDYAAGAGLSVGTNGVSIYEHGSGYMPAVAVGGVPGAGGAVAAYNYSNLQPSLWVQGSPVAQGSISSRTNVNAPAEIGAGSYGAFAGDVAEILVFNRSLTETEILGLEQHLAEQYALRFPRYYHANFKLDSDGEAVFLTRPDGVLADALPAVQIPRNASYGRKPDGGSVQVFFEVPTPGTNNSTPGATLVLSAPEFSLPAGFYTNIVSVAVTSTNPPGTQVHYTLDGSEPTTNSAVYRGAFTFARRAGTPNGISTIPTAGGWQPPLGEVFKFHVLRARAFRTNALSSETATASYCVDPRGRGRYALPVVSLTTDARNFFDPDIGIYVVGNAPGGNFAQSGDLWERPIHVEFFETNGLRVIAQESGVRMHGNTSFGFPIKALRLHPLNQKGRQPFRYRIFPDLPIGEFSRLLLRPSGHDFNLTMMRDGFMQNLVRELGLDMQGFRPAIVFLNGEYWGIHNVQEAYEKNYFASHYPGVDPEAVDYLEGYAPSAYPVEGQATHFHNLIAYMEGHDLSQPANYAYVGTQMEIPNYIDYKVSETFYYRWDIGNHRLWRPHTPQGRWRWIVFDQDVGYGGFWSVAPAYAFNMLAYNLEPNGPWTQFEPYGNDHNAPPITFQLRALLTNPNFKRDFINRFADLMNTTLATERMTNFIQRMAGDIAPEMAEHCARWRAPADWNTWSNNVAALTEFARNRPFYQRQHLTNQFALRGWVNVTLRVSDPAAGSVRLNTLLLAPPTNTPWAGLYFRDNPVTVAAVPNAGYRFKSWQGLFGPPSLNATNTLNLSGNLSLTAVFEAAAVTNSSVPAPYNLALGPYVFSRWAADAPAGAYPSNMIFVQTLTNAAPDPGLSVECTNLWILPYNLTQRSRINGLGEDGVAFLNTSDPQAEGGGYLGAAILALQTLGQTSLQVVWRGGTVAPGARPYAMRLQYRLGTTDPFIDLHDAQGALVEYRRSAIAGHSQLLGPVALPAAAENQPCLQLRWKYYWLGTGSGPRDQLRLDDIVVTPLLTPLPLTSVALLPDGRFSFQFAGVPELLYTVEASEDLAAWQAVETIGVGPDGLFKFFEPDPGRFPARFYRLRWP